MYYIIVGLIGLLVGMVTMFFVYRNNTKKLNDAIDLIESGNLDNTIKDKLLSIIKR
jgi:hypothetical protein